LCFIAVILTAGTPTLDVGVIVVDGLSGPIVRSGGVPCGAGAAHRFHLDPTEVRGTDGCAAGLMVSSRRVLISTIVEMGR
jgi:hypothetical protein